MRASNGTSWPVVMTAHVLGRCVLIGILPGRALLLCWLWTCQLSNAYRTDESETCHLGSVVSYCPTQPQACSMDVLPHVSPQDFILAGRTDMLGTDSLPAMCLPDLQKPG